MKTDVIVDYAHPCMMAERALKNVHEHMLRNDYVAAIEEALMALVETRIMLNSVRAMKEKADGHT